jgi:hypothetical protein
MIAPADVTVAATQRLSTTLPVWTTESRSAPSWFEAGVGEVSIAGDVSLSARGLSVEQHSERVLTLLRGERDAPAP